MSYFHLIFASLNVLVLTCVLAAALIVQFVFGDLPCPLCVMQRIAIMLCALAPLFLLAQNRRAAVTHRDLAIAGGMSVLAALLGAAIAARQVLLHIIPGDAGYGGTVWGMHLYSICLIVFLCQAVAAAVLLLAAAASDPLKPAQQLRWALTKGVFVAFGLVAAVNVLAVAAQAGWHWMLPPDPVSYLLLTR
ncbi:MAG: hypothetical protein JWP38_1097 [Herbaspirillum sp.]|nr:hypothetical protein [Herbaspirillum sp.]